MSPSHEPQGHRHLSERLHHDQWAGTESRDTQHDFLHFAAQENRWIASRLPDLRGARVLDVGCGLGEASLFFAQAGAEVTATDISPAMVAYCTQALTQRGYQVHSLVCPAEQLQLPSHAYDLIYCANLLHHVQGKGLVIGILADALRPGGRAYFIDPLRYNPIINVYRRMATRFRTADEEPVGFDMVGLINRHFGRVNYHCTWLLTQAIFIKYLLVNHVHPNQNRYWKIILDEKEETTGRWFSKLSRLDDILCRKVPALRYLCWNMVVEASLPR